MTRRSWCPPRGVSSPPQRLACVLLHRERFVYSVGVLYVSRMFPVFAMS